MCRLKITVDIHKQLREGFVRFTFFRRKIDPVKKVLSLIDEKEKYPVTPDTIRLFYQAIQQAMTEKIDTVAIRSLSVELYRTRKDLIDSLDKANDELRHSVTANTNFNHLQSLFEFSIDRWAIDSKDRRLEYSALLHDLVEQVTEHLSLLERCQKEKSKVRYQSTLSNLYTLHCDMLTLAEVYLRHFSQR